MPLFLIARHCYAGMSRGIDSPFESTIAFSLVRHACIDSTGDCSIVTLFNAKLLIKCMCLVAEKIQNKQMYFLVTCNVEILRVVQTVRGKRYLNLARSRLKHRSVNVGSNEKLMERFVQHNESIKKFL